MTMLETKEYSPAGEYPPHGYLQQLARAYRFFDRYRKAMTYKKGVSGDAFNDLEDFLWSFFQNCWHVKDWLRHDPTVPAKVKAAAVAAAEANRDLQVAADLANDSKHFNLTRERVGARDAAIQFHDGPDRSTTIVHLIALADGTESPAVLAGQRAIDAWREILKAHGLAYFQDPV